MQFCYIVQKRVCHEYGPWLLWQLYDPDTDHASSTQLKELLAVDNMMAKPMRNA